MSFNNESEGLIKPVYTFDLAFLFSMNNCMSKLYDSLDADKYEPECSYLTYPVKADLLLSKRALKIASKIEGVLGLFPHLCLKLNTLFYYTINTLFYSTQPHRTRKLHK